MGRIKLRYLQTKIEFTIHRAQWKNDFLKSTSGRWKLRLCYWHRNRLEDY